MLLDALEQAHVVLGRHRECSGRNAKDTITDLLATLDFGRLFEARRRLEADIAS